MSYGRHRRAGEALHELLAALVAFEAEDGKGRIGVVDVVGRIRRWSRRGGSPTLPYGPRKSDVESRMEADQDASELALVVADSIRARRDELGWTQQRLADVLGIPGFVRTHVSRLERGTHCPTLELLYALASVLETTPSVLVAGYDGIGDEEPGGADRDRRGREARPRGHGRRASARRGR